MVLRRFTKEVFTYADYKQALSEFVAKKEAEAAKGSGSASLRSVLQGWRPRNRSCGTLRLRGHKTVLPDGKAGAAACKGPVATAAAPGAAPTAAAAEPPASAGRASKRRRRV